MTQRSTPLCFLLLAATAAAIVAITSAQTADDNKILVSAAWLCEVSIFIPINLANSQSVFLKSFSSGTGSAE
ncbi:hypothetical protein V5799_006316 [Amblyomma americanum]|uniref:Secreted protein n=1 Tax=Amblyomma americanum TaxID=6943 RepID=A0AAQ4DWQ5_AMBAM